MSPVDEGLIHAWLEGQLPEAEAKRVADLVATDAAWSAAAAEARGLIAGSSRVLSALDHVPSVGTVASARAASPAWWNAPWLRAAAVLVFVAGTATVVWQNMPGDAGGALSMAPVAASAPAESQAVPPAASVRPSEQASGREQTAARADARQGTAPPAASARMSAAGAPPAVELGARQAKSTAAADTITVAANEARRRATGDSDSGRMGVTLAAPPVPLVERGVVGAVQRDQVDARLAGCWARIDSTGTLTSFAVPSRELAAAASAIVAMRFIGPVVTDVPPRADSQRTIGAVGGRGGGRAALLPRTAEADRATIIGPFNATTRMLADSSYVAEFVDEMGRAELSFVVAGDTLRGTIRRSAGDVRYPATTLRAVRVACPL